MTKPLPHDRIDEVIHQRTRLAIMATLSGVESLNFKELKALLALTDGNLSTHLTALEKAGYVEIVKSFKGKIPNTSVGITSQGKDAMSQYVELLRQILAGKK